MKNLLTIFKRSPTPESLTLVIFVAILVLIALFQRSEFVIAVFLILALVWFGYSVYRIWTGKDQPKG